MAERTTKLECDSLDSRFGTGLFDYPVPENHRQISYLMQLAPRVSFEHRLTLGASVAVGVVTVIVPRSRHEWGRTAWAPVSVRALVRADAALVAGVFVLISTFICISPCHVLMLNIIDCRTKKGGGPIGSAALGVFAMRGGFKAGPKNLLSVGGPRRWPPACCRTRR